MCMPVSILPLCPHLPSRLGAHRVRYIILPTVQLVEHIVGAKSAFKCLPICMCGCGSSCGVSEDTNKLSLVFKHRS